ncbi:MAG: hypothetical protein QM758_07330 [Armatimonas sp.]
MRRMFLKEEELPTRMTPVPQGATEVITESHAVHKAVPRKHREKDSPLKGKLLQAGILIFASLGIFSLLLPAFTGVKLTDLNPAETYSLANFSYLRGTEALGKGDLVTATNVFLTMPTKDAKTKEFYAELFPKLLEAKEYERVAQIMRHAKRQGASVFFFPNYKFDPQPLSVGALSSDMKECLGVERSLELIDHSPNLTAIRPALLPALFQGATPKELVLLEKLTLMLPEGERFGAVVTIIDAHAQAKNWDAAWRWIAEIPAEQRRVFTENYVLSQMAQAEPQEAIRRLQTWHNTPEFLSRFTTVFTGIAQSHPSEALPLLSQLSTPQLRDQAIGILLEAQTRAQPPLKTEEIAGLLDRQADPAMKAITLVRYLRPYKDAEHEFILNVQVPRLTALARQYPKLVPLYDDFLLDRMLSNCPQDLHGRYIAQLMDPANKKLAKGNIVNLIFRPQSARLGKAAKARFSLVEPIDAEKLTGLRD